MRLRYNRASLPEFLRKLIEKAYSDIANSKDLTTLNKDLANKAKELKIAGKDLAVSDLFDLQTNGCDGECGHNGYKVVLKASSLKRFVGLLHMNKDGEWELIKDAKVTGKGETIEFTTETMSPFAIVVDTSVEPNPPQTGDSSMIHVYATVMAVAALGVVAVVVKSRKRKV